MASIQFVSRLGDVSEEHVLGLTATGVGGSGGYFATCSCGNYQGPLRFSQDHAKDDWGLHLANDVKASVGGLSGTIFHGIERIPSTVSHAAGAGRLPLQTRAPDIPQCFSCNSPVTDAAIAELSQIRTGYILCRHHFILFNKGRLKLP